MKRTRTSKRPLPCETMIISLILAMDRQRVIGHEGSLPWHLPADLRYFKSVTMGKPIIMGRKTHETIGKALEGRHNIVMTRAQEYEAPGCTVVHSIEDALSAAGEAPEVMIIGGAEVYKQFLARADRIYLTLIEDTFEGTVRFPPLSCDHWDLIWEEEHTTDEGHPHSFRFMLLARSNGR